MIVDLKYIFATDTASLQINHQMDLSSLSVYGLFPLKKPVNVTGKVYNRASVVCLELCITYTYEAGCDRCGIDTVRDFSVTVDKSLAVSIEAEESDTIITVPDMKLDVDELVYSEVVLSLPVKFLCKEECRGLCELCGKNLNDGECNCRRKEIDPRLAKLAELLE